MERGTVCPSLGRLARIAELLDYPLENFFIRSYDHNVDWAIQLLGDLSGALNEKQWRGLFSILEGLKEAQPRLADA
jgi:hypothetical protein